MFDQIQAESPSFIRRSRHRNAMSTAASEKLGTTICWTTTLQGELSALLEVTHRVVSYNPWPGPIPVRAGWNAAHECWPAMGVLSDRGTTSFLDVVSPQDEVERELMGFEAALCDALRKRGIGLVTLYRGKIAAKSTMRVAREVRSYTGWPLSNDGVESELLRIIGMNGGAATFGYLSAASASGQSLVAAACVLIMRRVLKLSIDPAGFAASTVTVANDRVTQ